MGDGGPDEEGKVVHFIAALCTLRPASVLIIPTHLRGAASVQTVTIRI